VGGQIKICHKLMNRLGGRVCNWFRIVSYVERSGLLIRQYTSDVN